MLDDDGNIIDNKSIKLTDLQNVIANKCGISRSNVAKWYLQRDDIFKQCATLGIKKSQLVSRTGNVRGAKFPVQEAELRKIFAERRKTGRKISRLWFKLQFKRLLQRDKPDGFDSFKYSVGWFQGFINRKPRIVVRRTTNKKHIRVEDREHLIRDFHQFVHNIRCDTTYPHQSAEYRFKPENIGHFDEIPAHLHRITCNL